MGIERIPPEILRHILSHLNNFPCSSSESRQQERNRNLKNCSLVSSTWRAIAQNLLPDEIWISPRDQLEEGKIDRLATLLEREPFKDGKTRKLVVRRTLMMIEDDLMQKADETIDKRWKNVTYLQLSVAMSSMLSLANFTNLRKLYLYQVDLYLRQSEGVIFPNLSHLALYNVDIHDDLSLAQKIFSSTALPELVHLTLGCQHRTSSLKDVFVNLLPQITSLALSFPTFPKGALVNRTSLDKFFESYPRNNVLRHLLVDAVPFGLQDTLLAKGTLLDLDTLHIKYFPDRAKWGGPITRFNHCEEQYSSLLKGGGNVGCRTLVLYGCPEDVSSTFTEREDLVLKNEQKLPFEEFDGSF
ncbi:hypothetical protein JCM3765_006421 [Sporobolomyces pararoseus]